MYIDIADINNRSFKKNGRDVLVAFSVHGH